MKENFNVTMTISFIANEAEKELLERFLTGALSTIESDLSMEMPADKIESLESDLEIKEVS